jgi:putative GTP pyrophosphokinase
MINQKEFFDKYKISRDQFKKTGLDWKALESIYAHHVSKTPDLLAIANLISDYLRQIQKVHSLKIRIKDPEHLVEKIIRKKIEDSERNINLENYQTDITDLVGVRAMHLFKQDWLEIHKTITADWDTHETPIAYIRKGDLEEIYRESGCEVKEHGANYRSVHYLVKCQPNKKLVIAEIQVRTIFEEGWSEIDHQLRYPHDVDNPILAEYLAVFNRVAGNADEMGSFIRYLKGELDKREAAYEAFQAELKQHDEEKKQMIKDLEDIKKKLKSETTEKAKLQLIIDSMKRENVFTSNPYSNTDLLGTNHGENLTGFLVTNATLGITSPGVSVTGVAESLLQYCSNCNRFVPSAAGVKHPNCPYCRLSFKFGKE